MADRLITREQFELVRPLLEGARKRTRPREHDLYDIFTAVLYRDTTGCSWRKLPPDFPAWRTVHEYSMIWAAPGSDGQPIFDSALAILGLDRQRKIAKVADAEAHPRRSWRDTGGYAARNGD